MKILFFIFVASVVASCVSNSRYVIPSEYKSYNLDEDIVRVHVYKSEEKDKIELLVMHSYMHINILPDPIKVKEKHLLAVEKFLKERCEGKMYKINIVHYEEFNGYFTAKCVSQ